MKRFDKLILTIGSAYGGVDVEFTIIDILAGFKYVLIANHKIIVVDYKSKNSWKQIGQTIDLSEINK